MSGPRRLVVHYDRLPPSDNHIRNIQYRYIGGGRKAIIGYTQEAENYMKEFRTGVRSPELYIAIQRFVLGHKPQMTYRLEIHLFFPSNEILNASWLERWASDSRPGSKEQHVKGERKAKGPYKRVDSLNRRKLLEDCLSNLVQIDDSLNWTAEVTKFVSPDDKPAVMLILEEQPPEIFGIPPEYLDD